MKSSSLALAQVKPLVDKMILYHRYVQIKRAPQVRQHRTGLLPFLASDTGGTTMTNAIARPPTKGSHLTVDQLDHLCCAQGCRMTVNDDAPVPLCAHHLRIAFAHVLMNAEHKAAEVVESAAHEDEPTQIYRSAVLTTMGFVYFVRFSDRIKIGWSGNPTSRLRNVPHDEVLAIVPGTMEDERKMHAAFARYRVNGEWFEAKRDLLTFIASLPSVA